MEQLNQDNTTQASTTTATEPAVTYPTTPNAEGFFYESEEDSEIGILTKIYPNGNKIKKVLLPKCGRIAVVRELTGNDNKEIAKFMGKDVEKYQSASLTIATTIDGQRETFEFFNSLKLKDYNRLLAIHSDLNF
ncbi:hypothetical protein [Pinibacter soli]|uniref:Uncharacterized protein n=1 Tax=Pinibacter soli TaxID=3044211 RepID=A0ABT6RBP3_9BACT|nr:hypothetical protein [Pinibacter soli]MDI3319991.1 hypothetical protein [Pinibacter soli]